MNTYDIAITGLGMSGISLAAHLASRAISEPSILLIDPRKHYDRDKSWCHWTTSEHLFNDSISHSWNAWNIRYDEQTIKCSSEQYAYVHIDSGLYYQKGLELIRTMPNFDLKLGVEVTELQELDQYVKIHTQDAVYHANHIFDSRPRRSEHRTMLQHFLGWEVITDENVFDADVVTLMDFTTEITNGVHFFYVLPFTNNHALVETTHLSFDVYDLEQYEKELNHYMRNRLGARKWKIVRKENGVIPMSSRDYTPSNSNRITEIGTPGGYVKASSGYCFLATQNSVRSISDRYVHDGSIIARHPRSRLGRWFDKVFVYFLERYPERAPETFVSLFQNTKPDTLVRFLSDCPHPQDYLEVVGSLPTYDMTKNAAAHAKQNILH